MEYKELFCRVVTVCICCVLAFDIGLWDVFTLLATQCCLYNSSHGFQSVSLVSLPSLLIISRIAFSHACDTLTLINFANLKLPFQNPHREASFFYVASTGTLFYLTIVCSRFISTNLSYKISISNKQRVCWK